MTALTRSPLAAPEAAHLLEPDAPSAPSVWGEAALALADAPDVAATGAAIGTPHPILVQAVEDIEARKEELRRGLLQREARISPKFFYDAQGCSLYGAICELEEYYPTRTEAAIFAQHRRSIAATLPEGCQWVDLGCADGGKSWPWLEAVDAQRWVGVDISPRWLSSALESAAARFPRLERLGVACDFTQPLQLHPVIGQRPRQAPVFFYPGSSIGNFTPAQSRELLASVAQHLGSEGRLLIGVDGVKDTSVLEAAYDDALGVTAAFNRNVLRVVNREIGTDFEPRKFKHRAFFNPQQSRIEMHLIALSTQSVRVGTRRRRFEAGEAIVTEYSYKYTAEDFTVLLREAGFGEVQHWSDPQGWFHVFVAAAA